MAKRVAVAVIDLVLLAGIWIWLGWRVAIVATVFGMWLGVSRIWLGDLTRTRR